MNPQESSVQDPAPRVVAPDRSQVDPHPKIIDDLIPPDHPARIVWELVQELDLQPLYRGIKAVEHSAGRPAIDPLILVALWVFATEQGVSSARELARRCCDCDPYKWLCGGVSVNYHTLSDFRTDHGQWLKEQVVLIVATLRSEGLADLDNIGQDGMKVRASAGSDTFKKAETLERLLEQAEQQWEQLQQQFEGETDLSPRQQAARRRAAREKIERLKQAQQEVNKVAEQREQRKKGEGATARASTTDPEARRMKMGDGGTRPAYNVEFANDLDSLVILSSEVVNAGNDSDQMEPMVQQLEAEQEPLPPGAEYLTDGGFSNLKQVESLGARGVVVYTPVKSAKKKLEKGEDPFAPKRGDSPHVAAWRQRMGTEEAQEKYKQRSKAEWANAQCRNHGLWQFRVRGLPKVKAVVLWHVITHNLLRMVALRAQRAAVAA